MSIAPRPDPRRRLYPPRSIPGAQAPPCSGATPHEQPHQLAAPRCGHQAPLAERLVRQAGRRLDLPPVMSGTVPMGRPSIGERTVRPAPATRFRVGSRFRVSPASPPEDRSRGRAVIPRLPRFRTIEPSLLVNLRARLEPFDLKKAGTDVAMYYGGPDLQTGKLVCCAARHAGPGGLSGHRPARQPQPPASRPVRGLAAGRGGPGE